MKIHYICRGNVVRSLTAEAYTNSLHIPGVEATFSGTVAEQDRNEQFTIDHRARTVKLLQRHGLNDTIKATIDQVSQGLVDSQDVVVCVNQRAYDEATKIIDLPDTTIIWDVDDIGEGERRAKDGDRTESEEAIFAEVTTHVDRLMGMLGLASSLS
ncbi:MAG: hypothetical protein JWN33_438 [Candidatus Saccharibacteria bacterium]|nr:hypothetical protein [Candidatus Saccharibacteria bacterium]